MGNATEVVKVSEDTKARLDDLKPFPSVSYDDLIADMADHYERADREPTAVSDGGRE